MTSRRLLPILAALAVVAALASTAFGRGRCGDVQCVADMSISGYTEPNPVKKKQTTMLKILPKNNGPDGAVAVEVHVDVPEQLQILGARSSNGGGSGCFISGTFVQCNIGDFSNGQFDAIKIEVKGRKRGTWTVKARTFGYDIEDPDGGNGQTSFTATVKGRRGN